MLRGLEEIIARTEAFDPRVIYEFDQRGRIIDLPFLGFREPSSMSEEEAARSEKFTQDAVTRLQDTDYHPYSTHIRSMSEAQLLNGQIIQDQYLLVVDTFRRVTMGDRYTPLDAPESFVRQHARNYPLSCGCSIKDKGVLSCL